MTAIPPTTATRTPAAERMRRHRRRRRDGLRCLMMSYAKRKSMSLLRPERRDDYDSVQSALYAFLDRALGD
jgi:hypothetical protein